MPYPSTIEHKPDGSMACDGEPLGGSGGPHQHPISDVTNLQDALDAKADGAATSTALAGKSNTGHGHAQDSVANLVSDLAAKALASRTINTTAPLTGGGDLTANRTLAVSDASTSAKGVVELATDAENAANVVVQGNDSRLSNARSPTGNAGGELAGTYPNPTVTQARGLRHSDGTTLPMGAVADGQYLRRSGNNIVGDTPAGGGGNGDTTSLKTGDQQISAAGFVDVTGLSFPILAGETFHFEAFIIFQSSATTMGVLLGVNGPTNSLLLVRSQKQITVGGTASTDMFSESILTAYNTSLPNSLAEPALNVNLLCVMRGVITATANGTFTVRLSKENVAGNATVKAGSFIKYRKLG